MSLFDHFSFFCLSFLSFLFCLFFSVFSFLTKSFFGFLSCVVLACFFFVVLKKFVFNLLLTLFLLDRRTRVQRSVHENVGTKKRAEKAEKRRRPRRPRWKERHQIASTQQWSTQRRMYRWEQQRSPRGFPLP